MTETFDPPGSAEIFRAEEVASKSLHPAADRALRILVPPLVACLRVAGDLDGGDIYDLLAKAGIVQRESYDPMNPAHAREEFEDSEPGDEIWLLTDLGKQFT